MTKITLEPQTRGRAAGLNSSSKSSFAIHCSALGYIDHIEMEINADDKRLTLRDTLRPGAGTAVGIKSRMEWIDRGRNDARCSMLRVRKSEEGEDGALNGEILNQSTIKERMVGTSTFVSTKTSKVRMG